MNLKYWPAIIVLTTLTPAAFAEQSTVTGAEASASIRFVIHIPAQISLLASDSESPANIVGLNEGLLSVVSHDGKISALSWPSRSPAEPADLSSLLPNQSFVIASP